MDYEIQIKIKNARLLNAMHDASINGINKLAEATGLPRSFIDSVVNLTIATPFNSDGISYKENVTLLAEFLGVIESELFPDGDEYQPLKNTFASIQIKKSQIDRFISGTKNPSEIIEDNQFRIDDLAKAAGLKGREIEIIKNRFDDGFTLEQCGDIHGVSKDRVRQIEAKALRKIRIIAGKPNAKVSSIIDSWG